jgi:hypothetical protein
LLLSFQSSSINPFSPISPLIPSAQASLGLPRFLLPGGRHIFYFYLFSNFTIMRRLTTGYVLRNASLCERHIVYLHKPRR